MEPGYSARSEDERSQAGEHAGGATASDASAGQPVFPTLQELRDLPRRLLPDETYAHLKNAGREAALAIYSLWRSIDAARLGQSGNKVRKHIDVE